MAGQAFNVNARVRGQHFLFMFCSTCQAASDQPATAAAQQKQEVMRTQIGRLHISFVDGLLGSLLCLSPRKPEGRKEGMQGERRKMNAEIHRVFSRSGERS